MTSLGKSLLCFALIILVSGITWALKVSAQTKQQPNKVYEVKMTLTDWASKVNYLEYIKNQIRQSDIPSKQVAFMTDSLIIPLQQEISSQINQQMALEQKKDSIKPKR